MPCIAPIPDERIAAHLGDIEQAEIIDVLRLNDDDIEPDLKIGDAVNADRQAEDEAVARGSAGEPVLSTDPAKPAAGEQVIRPRHEKAGWPGVAALAL